MNEYLKIAREHLKKGNDLELLEYWDHLTKFNKYEMKKPNEYDPKVTLSEVNDLKKEILELCDVCIKEIENKNYRNLIYMTKECIRAIKEYHRKIDEYEKPSS